jgi:PPM family protein phosphatase
MASPAYTFHAATDVGQGREQNEDASGSAGAAGGELLVVCDGMGGHEAGDLASKMAVEAILQIFAASPEHDPAERLRAGFLVANQRIVAHATGAKLDGMGTTAVAAFVKDGEAWIAHVGDSRCYHLRGDQVLWRTADHTRVQRMVEMGILTAEQARTHEDANVVTRALGFSPTDEPPEPEIASRELRDGDLLVLCSDGLYDLVDDTEIAELGSEDPPAAAAQRLVDLANERGGHDNISVTVARWGSAAPARTGPRKTDRDLPPSRVTTKTADLASSVATARAILAGDAQRSRALRLAVGGLVLVALALAVFLLTRGGP